MSDEMPRTVSVPDEEILNAFSCSESPIATVRDLEKQLALQADSIRVRLKQMEEEEEKVNSKKVGSRAVVWWRAE